MVNGFWGFVLNLARCVWSFFNLPLGCAKSMGRSLALACVLCGGGLGRG